MEKDCEREDEVEEGGYEELAAGESINKSVVN